MNLTNYYWYFQSAIPHRVCDDIVKYGKSIQDQMAVTGGYGNNTKTSAHVLANQMVIIDSLACWPPDANLNIFIDDNKL